MEQPIVNNVLFNASSEAIVTIKGAPNRPGVAALVFEALGEQKIVANIINQNSAPNGFTDLTFSVSREYGYRARDAVAKAVEVFGGQGVSLDQTAIQVIVRGTGLSIVFARVFRVLGEYGCNIKVISTSSVEIECVVVEGDVEGAIQELQELTKEFWVKRQVVGTLRTFDVD